MTPKCAQFASPLFARPYFGRRFSRISARLRVNLGVSVLLTMLFATLGAHAEETGASSQHSAENFFKWINFTLVAGVIVWICLKYGSPYFKGRADSIGSAIQKSAEAKNQADRQLRDAETKLENLEKEVAEL